jgi:hypothetical protein
MTWNHHDGGLTLHAEREPHLRFKDYAGVRVDQPEEGVRRIEVCLPPDLVFPMPIKGIRLKVTVEVIAEVD